MRSTDLVTVALVALACARHAPDPMRYRLASANANWAVVDGDHVLEDLSPRYPEFFAVILDPAKSHEPNPVLLRDDLEHVPVDRRNFDALNTIAIAYFEINYRAEAGRGGGLDYLSRSQQAAKLLALPWRAYSIIDDGHLRDEILVFFEDAGSGRKPGTGLTAGRVIAIVESLEKKENDPARRARIQRIVSELIAAHDARQRLLRDREIEWEGGRPDEWIDPKALDEDDVEAGGAVELPPP